MLTYFPHTQTHTLIPKHIIEEVFYLREKNARKLRKSRETKTKRKKTRER